LVLLCRHARLHALGGRLTLSASLVNDSSTSLPEVSYIISKLRPVCFAISMWLFTPIMNQWGFKEMLLPLAFRGIAVPFAIASTVTLTMGNLPPDRLKSASGLFALMRNLGGAIGIAVSATVVNDRTNLHFLRIAEHLNFSNTEL